MEYSKKRDLIARQYSNGFKDIFNIGVPAYKKFYNKWGRVNWALTGVYLTFLKKFNDSHIARNKGNMVARGKKVLFFSKKKLKFNENKKKITYF